MAQNNSEHTSEPNAMNSELHPEKHPSGARIEKMMSGQDLTHAEGEVIPQAVTGPEKGVHGEILRPSEREDRYIPPEEPAEGSRDIDQPSAPHRMNADDRQSTH